MVRERLHHSVVKLSSVKLSSVKGCGDFHHGVTYVTRNASERPATPPAVVAPSDEMMTARRSIEHLDFEPTCDGCEDNPRPADFIIEGQAHLPHIASAAKVGEMHAVCGLCWSQMSAVSWASCECGERVPLSQMWRIVEVLR